MRILLVNPQGNYPHSPPVFGSIGQGPAYIAGILKQKGHEVLGVNTSWDITGDPAPIVLERTIKKKVRDFQPEIIATGAMAGEFLFLEDTIKAARKFAPHIPIILGGSILTNDKTIFEVLRPDFGVIDEGEFPLIELLSAIKLGSSVKKIENVAYWENGKAIYNKLRNANYELDDLPFPDYEPLEITKWHALSNQYDNYYQLRTRKDPRQLPITSGRSCPFRCTFCQYDTLEGSRRKYRSRSSKSIINEIMHFQSLYGINLLQIYDDLFSVKSNKIYEFCESLKKNKIDVHWNASMRVGDVTPDLLAAMKDAGCINIGYGFESANDDILKSMNKGITKQQIKKAIEMTEKAKLGIQANFIYGDPKETEETAINTKKFNETYCMDHIVHSDYVTPYPGSPIYDHSVKKGLIKNKEEYNRTLIYRPRYNMTNMTDKKFYEIIEPAIRPQLAGAKFAEIIDISIDTSEKYNHPFFKKNRVPYNVKCKCVHCKSDQDFTFPMPVKNLKKWQGKSAFIKPLKYFCANCHKRFLISMMDIAGLKPVIKDFIQRANDTISLNKPVVICPTTSYDFIDGLMANGLNFEQLNINSFLHRGHIHDHMSFLNFPCYQFNQQFTARNSHLTHIILPENDSIKTYNELLTYGVAPENIIKINTETKVPEEFLSINNTKLSDYPKSKLRPSLLLKNIYNRGKKFTSTVRMQIGRMIL